MHILRWTSFLIIPVISFYDEYIDRRKVTEQKKSIWVYSTSPSKEGRNNNLKVEFQLNCVYSFLS